MWFGADKAQPRAGWRGFGWLWPYVRPHLRALASVLTVALFISVLSTLQPYLSKLIIDDALLGRNFPLLVQLSGLIVGLAVVAFAAGAVNRWHYTRVSGRILFALREDVYAHLLALPPGFFRRRPVGDLVARLDGDVAEVQRFSTDTLLSAFNSILLLAVTAVIMALLSWRLALVAATVLPLQLLLRHKARPWISSTTRSVREQASEVTHFLVETLGAVKAVQGAATEEWERQRLADLNRSYLRRVLRQQLVGYASGGLSNVLSHCATAAVFIAGGYGVMQGSLTVGTLVAFVAYMARGTNSALSLLNIYTAYQRAAVSLERVEQLRAAPSHARIGTAVPVADGDDPAGHLVLDHVTVRHDTGGRAVLDDACLDIAAGSKIVICGDSGVGKTTLADALRGFVEIESGNIRLDGQDIAACPLQALRRRIVTIEAEPVMFRGSILHNLRYGNFHAAEADLLDAARRAGVDEVVSDLPEGYGTQIGGGNGISAGQRQRIALARALLADPLVLVLDEATSHLDPAATASLHALIDDHFAQRTRIVITHAPQAVPRADAVYELIAGRFHLRSHVPVHV
ncbi:MAG TPA: ABC transporter transmembrane domain-containing protein [Steroidobacter sp.]|uniref:ABC transporter ATP-binding protein n=1 Tax=Steroidobacter sp. TaxID=1978227 RepID=UPI002ED98283